MGFEKKLVFTTEAVKRNMAETPAQSEMSELMGSRQLKGYSSTLMDKESRMLKRRHSSEGALIHITGTGTISEEALNVFKGPEEAAAPLPQGVGQYDDFHTMDWQRDLSRDMYRQRYVRGRMGRSLQQWAAGQLERASGWLCVCLVGLAAGCVSCFVDIGEAWMKDLKTGVCREAFWLNRQQCCWSANGTFYEGDECELWFSWHRLFRLELLTAEEYLLSYGFFVFWSLLFASLACSFILTYAPYASGSGIPEIKTILSGFIMRGYLGRWTLVTKALSTMLAVASGLSLGKEGPLVHIVCCLGNVIAKLFPRYAHNEAKKREILSAAVAAGVSIAFMAPIGGVLFSLEEVSYYFPPKTLWRSFVCALVAAFVLRSMDPYGTDSPAKFHVGGAVRPWAMLELLPFVALGVLGGLIGSAFIRANTTWTKFRKSSGIGNYPFSEVLTVTLVTALISFPNPFMRMNTIDLIKTLFEQCGNYDSSPLCDYKRAGAAAGESVKVVEAGPGVYSSLYLLLLTLLCTFVLTIFTFGIRVPTGLFIPSLAMGAIMGRIVGIGMQQLAFTFQDSWPFQSACTYSDTCMAPGLYAMIGAAACLAGITRMTVSLVVIMFELTGSVDSIVPLMATVIASKWVADAIDKDGIYDAHIQLNQYPYLNNKKSFRCSSKAIDIVTENREKNQLHTLQQKGMTLKEIENTLNESPHNGFPVTTTQGRPTYLKGFVLRRDLCLTIDYMRNTYPETSEKWTVEFFSRLEIGRRDYLDFSRIVDMAPITVSGQTPTETVVEMFYKLGLRQILVTDNGKLLGIITKKDVLKYMMQEKLEDLT